MDRRALIVGEGTATDPDRFSHGWFAFLERVSIAAFQQGLRDLGYVEGRTIGVEYRYGEGKTERFPGLVAELAQQNPAVIVVAGATATRAATRVTKGIPLVMTNVTVELPRFGGGFTAFARTGDNSRFS